MKTFSSRSWRLAAFALTLFKIWLAAATGIFAIPGAGHDDGLFMKLADHILQGNWLGPYDDLTLAKGPFYSIWMAANFWIGLPLTTAQAIVYALASWLLAKAIQPLHRRDAITFIVFALLLWNPMSYEGRVLARIFRQTLSTSTGMMVFAGAIALHTRNTGTFRSIWPWAVLLGFGFGTLWITREDSIWLIPSIVLLLSSAAVAAWKTQRAAVVPLLKGVTLAVVCGAAPVLTVCALNLHYYGWFGTVEFRAPEFIGAYGALCRVKPKGNPIPYVPVLRETRVRLYEYSPALAELKPYLEGDIGFGWAGASSHLTKRPNEEREIAGGWLVWALRDATRLAGHCKSAADAIDFYGRIAREVNAACDKGLVEAGPPHNSLLPPWKSEYTKALWPAGVEFADFFATFKEFRVHPFDSLGNAEQLALVRDVSRDRLTPSLEAPELVLTHQKALNVKKLGILYRVGKVLRRVFFALTLAGLVVWLVRGLQSAIRRRPAYLWFVATSALGASIACLLVNLLVHVSSFPALNVGYFAPGYPFLILFGSIALLDGALAWIPALTPRVPDVSCDRAKDRVVAAEVATAPEETKP